MATSLGVRARTSALYTLYTMLYRDEFTAQSRDLGIRAGCVGHSITKQFLEEEALSDAVTSMLHRVGVFQLPAPPWATTKHTEFYGVQDISVHFDLSQARARIFTSPKNNFDFSYKVPRTDEVHTTTMPVPQGRAEPHPAVFDAERFPELKQLYEDIDVHNAEVEAACDEFRLIIEMVLHGETSTVERLARLLPALVNLLPSAKIEAYRRNRSNAKTKFDFTHTTWLTTINDEPIQDMLDRVSMNLDVEISVAKLTS